MADSEPEPPSMAVVADGIRDIVISMHKAGNDDALTVNKVRSGAEQKLGLPDGFLKDGDWKDKSKKWIKEAVDQYCVEDPAPTPSPKRAVKTKTKPKLVSKGRPNSSTENAPRGAKRKVTAPAKKPKKRRKTASSEEESETAPSDPPSQDSELSGAENEPPKQPARRRMKTVAEDSSEEDHAPRKPTQDGREDMDSDEKAHGTPSAGDAGRSATPQPSARNDASEDEMSDVLDESPVKNKRKQKAGKVVKAAKGVKAQPKAAKAKPGDDPEQAEVKRLQGWLVKCGIRKVWGKELKDCETSKEKIRHLKDMLKEAGMDGKYSVEKAARIKEQREFAKDLEDIQAGAAVWGDSSSTGRPRRAAAARAVQPVVTLDDIDDEKDEGGAQEDRTEDDDDDDKDDDEVHEESSSDGSKSDNDEDHDDFSD